MVSGFVTSPCDQLRIFSGEARLMRIESKSASALAKSKGLERYKVSSIYFSGQWSVLSGQLRPMPFKGLGRQLITSKLAFIRSRYAGTRRNALVRRRAMRLPLTFGGLDQFHIQAQRLQLAHQHVKRLWHAGLDGSFALDDGLVNLGAAVNV